MRKWIVFWYGSEGTEWYFVDMTKEQAHEIRLALEHSRDVELSLVAPTDTKDISRKELSKIIETQFGVSPQEFRGKISTRYK